MRITRAIFATSATFTTNKSSHARTRSRDDPFVRAAVRLDTLHRYQRVCLLQACEEFVIPSVPATGSCHPNESCKRTGRQTPWLNDRGRSQDGCSKCPNEFNVLVVGDYRVRP